MTKRETLYAAFILALIGIATISGCKKDNNGLPLEPISLITPNTPDTSLFAGDNLPLKFAVTTDRPINWIMCVYDIDTFVNSTTYVPTYPDTLFYKSLLTLNPPVNLYTDTSSFQVPGWARAFSVVRFKITFQAGSAFATYGQNYPVGLVSDEKDFVIDVK